MFVVPLYYVLGESRVVKMDNLRHSSCLEGSASYKSNIHMFIYI